MSKISHKTIVSSAAKHVALTAAYVLCVTAIMSYAPFNAAASGVLGVFAVLMLMTLTATVLGALIFAKPVIWFLEGQKKEAAALLCWTIGLLAVVFGLALFLMA